MKTRTIRMLFAALLSLGLLAGVSSTAVAQDGAESLKVDPVHSNVLFRVQHFNAGYFYGEFVKKEGAIKFDTKNPENSTVELTIDANSIETHNKKRNDHLKSPDFFNAKQHPKITFKSAKFEKAGKDKYKVTGNLTMNGKTKKVTADVEQVGAAKDPQGNFRRGFHTVFNIKRSDFDINFMEGLLGDDVQIIVAVEGVRQ